MKMKGQIDSVYPPAKEAKKKNKKASKKAAQAKQKGKAKSKNKKQADIVTTSAILEQVESVIAPVKEATQAVKDTLEETIQALEKNHHPVEDAPAILNDTEDSKTKNPITRASKNSQPLVDDDKQKTMQRIIKQLILGDISQGDALKILRIQVLGLKQEDFASLVGVSRKTLSENENNKGNYTADIVNKLFQPFDLKVGLLPSSVKTLETVLASKKH